MTAAYEFSKRGGAGRTCLLLENHPVMGGEAKQNEFVVDGRRLTAPQGSNAGLVIKENYVKGSYGAGRYDVYTDYYRELGLPTHFDLEPLSGGAERYDIPNYHFAPMHPASESSYDTAYHFRDHGWVRNPAQAKFGNTPWPEPRSGTWTISSTIVATFRRDRPTSRPGSIRSTTTTCWTNWDTATT